MHRWMAGATLVLLAGCRAPTTDDWLAQLGDAEVVKRRQAIRELAVRSGEADRIVPALAESLRDGSPFVRRDAAAALGKFGPAARQALPALRAALKDRDRSVRRTAAEVVRRIDPQGPRPGGKP